MMKDKNVAALLAIFLGMFGAHRFYLGQIKLGILYCLLSLVGISVILMIIDFFVFLIMDKEIFDLKYNRKFVELQRRDDTDYDRYENRRRQRDYRERDQQPRYNDRQRSSGRRTADFKNMNPYKASGIQRYKEYDYEEAIEDFKKVLETEPNDISVHFNLACAHSLLEQEADSFYHLNRAIELGFKDYHRIRNHDALAYLRTQPAFEELENRVMNPAATSRKTPETNTPLPDLLEQIQQLGKLREQGLLTDEEFVAQKKKLLG